MQRKRAILIASGNVQKVGYRDYIQDVGRELGIKGYIENLRTGNVQIVCEANDEIIKKFIELIKIKKDFIDVKNVELKETSDATDEFEYLDIKYGTIEEELGERMGVGILYIGATTDEVRKVGDKIEESKNEITQHIDQSRDQMIKHIDGNFNTLDEKYHTVSETLISLNKNLVASQEQLR